MAAEPLHAPGEQRPRLRGVLHGWAFLASIPLGVALVLVSGSGDARVAATIFAVSVVTMFGASALYHRAAWTPRTHLWFGRLDHAAIYGLVAGTYAPFGLLALDGTARTAVLATVWIGCATALLLKLFWASGPKWTAPFFGVGLGWVGVVVAPELARNAGVVPFLLVVAGGLFYSAGAVVYTIRRPDPAPRSFGYHEVFHALVTGGVALQYVAVALLVA